MLECVWLFVPTCYPCHKSGKCFISEAAIRQFGAFFYFLFFYFLKMMSKNCRLVFCWSSDIMNETLHVSLDMQALWKQTELLLLYPILGVECSIITVWMLVKYQYGHISYIFSNILVPVPLVFLLLASWGIVWFQLPIKLNKTHKH